MLRVEGLHKTFISDQGEVRAVTDVSFEVKKGQFFTLLGSSGCGKTTTLRCVAGLELADTGAIWIDEKAVCIINENQRKIVPAHRRGVGMVFQSYAIWPHLTVAGNVAFPLLYGRESFSRAEIKEKGNQRKSQACP
jgi:iron(III) transport system ATP-binding protein